MILSKPSNTRQFSTLYSTHRNQRKTLFLSTLLKSGFTPTLKQINQFLLFLSQNHKFKSIILLFSQLNSNQITGDSHTHFMYASALLREHKYIEAAKFLKIQMAKTSISQQNRIFDSLIQGICINVKDPEKAFCVLKDGLRIDDGILPSSFTFRYLIHCFSSKGMMDGAIEVLELMTDEKIRYPFDNFVSSSVISGFVKIGKPELAIAFYENAEKSGALRTNIVTITALVTAYCMLGRIGEVSNLVYRMENEGLAFDAVFYSNWIYEYFREEIPVEAFRKHGEMVKRKIDLDTISYTIIIDGFSKEGNVEKAVGFLNNMKKDGLEPNLVTYTAIMLGFCKKGKIEEAFAVLKVVENLGIKVDELTYATLIDGVCKRGDYDFVFRLLDEMEKKGISPSIVTYNTVINGLCKARRTSEADNISKGILGDAVTYSTLLNGYIEEQNITATLEIVKRLEAAGVCFDVVMCNVLIKALFMVGSFEDALAMYEAMPEMDLAADSVTYCTMINGCCKTGRIDEALEIFDEFRRASIFSVACYNCIIHGLCRKRMTGMAIEVLIELNERGLPLDAGIYMMLIKTIFKEKGADGVLNLVHRIDSDEHDTYDAICDDVICFLCKRGFTEAASEVYTVVTRKKGSGVTSRSYYSLLKGLIYEGKKWLTMPILGAFVKNVGIFESRVRRILVHYLCMGNVNGALRFLAKTKEKKCSVTLPVTVLETLMKDGRVLDAYELVMGAKDNLPFLDVVDYSKMVDGLCKGGHVSKALDLCAFVGKKGITLNIITYNSVINGLCRQGCLVEAFRLFDSLEKIDIIPSEATYATLIDTLSKGGYLLDAKNLFERMILNGFKLHTRVFNSLINEYCKLGQMQEAIKLLHDLEVKCLDPDEFTVSAVINGYCLKGDMEAALVFFFELKRKAILPDFLGFMYLINGLCARGRMEESRSILREMLQSQSVVDVLNRVDNEVETESLESFLVLLCEQGNIQEAVAILNEVGPMFFPVGTISGADNSSKILKERETYDGKACDTVGSKSLICNYEIDLDLKLGSVGKLEKGMKRYSNQGDKKGRLLHDFDSCYALISSLCSRGELLKANKLVSIPGTSSTQQNSVAKENPFTAKASLIRYWNIHISNHLPKPHFLLSKASPLSAVDSAFFTKLATQNALSSHLSSFCSSANLFCTFESMPALSKHNDKDANFALYTNKHFSNYGTSHLGGVDSFKNYSGGINFAIGSFTQYSRRSTGHREGFSNYANDGNVATSNFTSYASGATGGSGEFNNYMPRVNVPDLRFSSYNADGNNHKLSFSSYADDTNSGNQGFTSYGKNGNGVPVEFTSYGDTSNVVGSTFSGYGESGNAANDSFKAYSSNANNPGNSFKSYSTNGNAAIDTFSSYRDGANVGTDTFQSYSKNSNSGKTDFVNYGKSVNEGIDMFKEYGKGSKSQAIGFKIYGLNSTFKEFAKKDVTFAQYTRPNSTTDHSIKVSGNSVNSWVEEGKFFREDMLKEGIAMKMPDIRDKMPERSFLPGGISSKLPFSTSQLSEIKQIFHTLDGSSMEGVIVTALTECEREPSKGEAKRCVASVEDMIDFATSVLGHNVVVRTSENVNGSKKDVIIGKVTGINGGKVTKSVSCHQSLYPYLLYYCHSVPKVRVYVADILDVDSKVKINDGVAICHIDTSAWSPGHGAFVALGSGPGFIEVCHWVFENDMTWTVAE